MNIDIFLSAFLVLCGLQGIYLSFIIYKNMRGKRHEKYFLIFLISIFSLNIIAGEIVRNLEKDAPDFIISSTSFQLLIGPVFYFYCKSIVISDFKHKFSNLLNFLPFIFYFIYLVLNHIFEPLLPFLNPVNKAMWLFIIIQLAYYLLAIRKMLIIYKKNLNDNYSAQGKYNLEWLNYIFTSIILVVVLYYILFILIFHNLNNSTTIKVFSIFLTFFIYFFGYKGLRQKGIYFEEDRTQNKYAKSALTKEYMNYWKEKLIKSIENEKLFLDPELSLAKLAGIIGISENNLSQIINSELGITFYELINNYRIEEVKKFLSNNEDANILESAFAAGFNSKTAFNTIFKKKTGLTPSQFIKNIKP